MRRTRLLACILLLAAPLHAAGHKKYPLNIQIRKASYGCSNCIAFYPLNTDPPARFDVDPHAAAQSSSTPPPTEGPPQGPERLFSGSGSGVLLLAAGKTQAFRFTYDRCINPLPLTVALVARWKKPGRDLEVLVPPYSPHKDVNLQGHLSSCRLNVSLRNSHTP